MTEIGPYTVVRELGRGGMGVVYEVRHPDIPRPLALKLQLDVADAQALARFQREVELLARLQHPGIVAVHTCGQTPRGQPYLVTEMVSGEDLHDVTRRQGCAPQEAARLVAELAGAVGALHAAGIVHRDLKPRNVILTPEGRPVLLDLGVARDLSGERLTRTGQMLGTPAYMSPEQVDNSSSVDERCDVYGLGAILFTLLTGSAPFVAHGFPALLKKILTAPPEWPEGRDVPRPLRVICERALAKEPNERQGSAKILGAELEAFLAGEAPRGSRTPLLLASAFLLVAILVALGLLALPGPESDPLPSPAAPDQPATIASETPTAPPAPGPPARPYAVAEDPNAGLEALLRARGGVSPERAQRYAELVEWIYRNRNSREASRLRARLDEKTKAGLRSHPLQSLDVSGTQGHLRTTGAFLDHERLAVYTVNPFVPPELLIRRRAAPADPPQRYALRSFPAADPRKQQLGDCPRVFSVRRGPKTTEAMLATDAQRVYRYELTREGLRVRPGVGENLEPEDEPSGALWALPQDPPAEALNRHLDFYTGEISPDGRLVAVAGSWKGVFLLGLPEGRLLKVIGGADLPAPVSSLAFSTDSKLLLTANKAWEKLSPRDAMVFDVASGRLLATVPEAEGANLVEALPDPEEKGRTLFIIGTSNHVRRSPGEPAGVYPSKIFVYAHRDEGGRARWLEPPRPAAGIPLLGSHTVPISSLAVSSDGGRVYSASRAVRLGEPATLQVWDLSNPDEPRWIRTAELGYRVDPQLVLSPGDHWLLVGGDHPDLMSDDAREQRLPGRLSLFGAGDW